MVDELKSILKKFNQEHLLNFIHELNDEQKNTLITNIQNVDLENICSIFKEAIQDCTNNDSKYLEPLDKQVCQSINDLTKEKIDHYRQIGLRTIGEGKVGVIILAGGQGTRLGVNYPKGMYDIGLPSKKSLFQIQAERLKRLQFLSSNENRNGKIHCFIMTSSSTNQTTIDYFKQNQYFGLEANQITFFEQGTLPCFTFDGKIILNSKYQLSLSPDGNGGLYEALRKNKIIDHMKKLKIEYLHAFSVDNILIKLADPIFLGYCIDKQADTGVKSVEKDSPYEAVGVFCKVNGRNQVVEYSEISKELCEKTDENGKLLFRFGNICNHFFTTDFLSRVVNEKLPHHVAKKKISYIDNQGNFVEPREPNGIKLEKFIFDVIPYSERFVVLDVIRREEFAPVKNNNSASRDTPITARFSIFDLHRKYIENAGGLVIKKSDKQDIPVCEISPLLSYDGENLKHLVHKKIIEDPVIIALEGEKTKTILNFVDK